MDPFANRRMRLVFVSDPPCHLGVRVQGRLRAAFAYLVNEARREFLGERRTVEVIRTEEKGSDVNLATMLLVDSFAEEFELAVVISNDSDLAMPIEVVRQMGFDVGILNPAYTGPASGLAMLRLSSARFAL